MIFISGGLMIDPRQKSVYSNDYSNNRLWKTHNQLYFVEISQTNKIKIIDVYLIR